MASKTTLNAKNLEALGAARLAELLIEISTGSAANKRRLRIELAGMQSGGEVAREVAKRLSSIERSRSKIGWRRVKALRNDLDIQRRIITETIASTDAYEALDVMWRLMDVAGSVFERCDDSNGTIMAVFRAACIDLGEIAKVAKIEPRRLADRAFNALRHNDYGQFDGLVETLAQPLGQEGLEHLKSLFAEWSATLAGESAEAASDWADLIRPKPERIIRLALEDIADAEGDIDAFIALKSEQAKSQPSVAAEIARRLLATGRASEALDAVNRVDRNQPHLLSIEWEVACIDALEALGRRQEAQDFRWQCFERALSAQHLRSFLKRLPDFDDVEAEDKAFAYISRFPDVHRALAFLVSWPALAKASELAIARSAELNGDHYEQLTSAAEALRERYPLAATILLRAMIDFALYRVRATRYRHAARHLTDCGILARNIEDFGGLQSHDAYVAGLKRSHGKKHGFWSGVETH
jgi:hypothetical protein